MILFLVKFSVISAIITPLIYQYHITNNFGYLLASMLILALYSAINDAINVRHNNDINNLEVSFIDLLGVISKVTQQLRTQVAESKDDFDVVDSDVE